MPTNKLLSALPSEDRDRLSPFLTTSPMRLRLVLYKQDAVRGSSWKNSRLLPLAVM